MANSEQPPYQNGPEPFEERIELLPENVSDVNPAATAEAHDLTQEELLIQLATRHQRDMVGLLGRLAFLRHKSEPRASTDHDVSRRGALRYAGAAGAAGFAVMYGLRHIGEILSGVSELAHKGGEVKNLLTFKKEFDDQMAALPSDEDIEKDIPNLGRVIDLDEWQEQRGTIGKPVNIYVINVGTSNSFGLGTDDLGHPYEQEHAAVYRASVALKEGARNTLNIGVIKTLVLARPGAYSGEQFPGVTDAEQPLDGILVQLEDRRIQELIDQAGPDDIIIVRYEGGFDDLRLLADDIGQIETTLNRLQQALDSDEPVSDEIREEFKAFGSKLNDIAAGYNQNFQSAAAKVARYSDARVAKGGAPIFFQPNYTWSLFTQARVPFGLLKKQADDASLPTWLKPDLTDYNPKILRYFIEIDAIKEGNNLARWAWVTLCLAQTAALKSVMLDIPDLQVVPEVLIGVNADRRFYAALVNGVVDMKGDGHPGLVDDGRVNGIDLIAARVLQIWRRYVIGQGEVSADDYAEFSGRPPRLVA